MQYHLKVSCFFDSASSCSDSSLYIDRILVNLVHFILRNPNVSFSSAVLFFVSQGISQLFKQCFRYFTVFHLFFLIFNSSLMCKSYSFLNYFLQCRLDICRINFDFLLFSIYFSSHLKAVATFTYCSLDNRTQYFKGFNLFPFLLL